MSFYIPWDHVGRPGDLLSVIIHGPTEDGTGMMVDSVYQPTEQQVTQLLQKYNLPVQYCLQLIEDRDQTVHTIILELDKFTPFLREQGL